MNVNLKNVEQMLEELIERVTKLEELVNKPRRTGPHAALRPMTDEDARRVLNGDMRDVNHTRAAEQLGLSYAQVYSCRHGDTFKHIHKELREVSKS